MVRYAIGGSTPNTFPCGEFRDGAATESFKDGPDVDFDCKKVFNFNTFLHLKLFVQGIAIQDKEEFLR